MVRRCSVREAVAAARASGAAVRVSGGDLLFQRPGRPTLRVHVARKDAPPQLRAWLRR